MPVVLAIMITSWRHAQRAIFGVLGPFWVFVGVVFQYAYLRPLYRPGRVFAVLWVTEGMLLIFSANRASGPFGRRTERFEFAGSARPSRSSLAAPVVLPGNQLAVPGQRTSGGRHRSTASKTSCAVSNAAVASSTVASSGSPG